MPRLRGASVMLAILVAASAGSAVAAPLEKAKAAIENSEYFAARSELETALRAGDNKPAELAEIHRLSGIVAAALGDPKAAKEAFQRCYALLPASCALPPGTSPKIAKQATAAQDFFKDKQPLSIKTTTAGEPPSVTIDVVDDPLSMIAKLQAIVVVDGKPEQTLDKPVDNSVKIDLPKGARLDLRVAALDEHGNHLFEVGSKDVPVVIVGKAEAPKVVVKPPPPPKPVAPFEQRPLYLRWWLWAGASVVTLGASGWFGIDAVRQKNKLDDLNAESANHSFDEALAIEDKARRSVLITNITLIAGGAFAITAGVLYLTRPKQTEAPPAKAISIAPVVHPTGGGLVLGGHF